MEDAQSCEQDIRLGYISRKEGIDYVEKYDHIKPMRDLNRWLDYVDMEEENLYNSDSFETKSWKINEDKKWFKKMCGIVNNE